MEKLGVVLIYLC